MQWKQRCKNLILKVSYLEILWQLGSASITRVHCDEVANGGVHGDVLVHELKPLLLLTNGILDALDLCRKYVIIDFG